MTEAIHPHLIRTYITIIKKKMMYIIMPLMSYGDLEIILKFKYPNSINDEK